LRRIRYTHTHSTSLVSRFDQLCHVVEPCQTLLIVSGCAVGRKTIHLHLDLQRQWNTQSLRRCKPPLCLHLFRSHTPATFRQTWEAGRLGGWSVRRRCVGRQFVVRSLAVLFCFVESSRVERQRQRQRTTTTTNDKRRLEMLSDTLLR